MSQIDYDAGIPDKAETIGYTQKSLKIDEAIKMLFGAEKGALIRLINGALGESYDLEKTKFTELNTEFVNTNFLSQDKEDTAESFDLEKIIADMMFSLDGVVYHIEFQTKADNTIVIRIVGYGTSHALSNLKNSTDGDEVIFELPIPVLIQIDKDDSLQDKIPARIKLSGREDSLRFDITVIRLWTFDIETILERGYYLLLPFLLIILVVEKICINIA